MGAFEEAARTQELPFRLGGKGDVNRRRAAAPAETGERVGEMGTHGLGVRAAAREQPASGRGRERHGNLQLRIVTASGALVGFRPAMIEDVFAARMRFCVARDDADNRAAVIFGDEVHRLPSGARSDRLRYFQRRQEIVRNKRVVPIS